MLCSALRTTSLISGYSVLHRFDPIGLLKHYFRSTIHAIALRAQYAEPKMRWMGFFGVFGFPIYYIMWTQVYPQPYENLTLRIIGAIGLIPLIFVKSWPGKWRKFLPIYWYAIGIFALPFFFTYMTLRNGFNVTWQMSSLIALFFMVLIFNFQSLIVTAFIGIAIAICTYLLGPSSAFTVDFGFFATFVVFTIGLSVIVQVSNITTEQEKLKALIAAATDMAHELRTPLLSIRAIETGLSSVLPEMIEGHAQAVSKGLIESDLRPAQRQRVAQALQALSHEVDYANTTIDMLLVSVRPISLIASEKLSMRECLEQAIARYPFGSQNERSRVNSIQGDDFTFMGSTMLMTHVIFNLLKNAIRHCARYGRGDITLILTPGSDYSILVFRDTGPGIEPEVLPYIFQRFYSSGSAADNEQRMGVGLAFCRSALERMHATIECQSVVDSFTEFVLHFPTPGGRHEIRS